jgi:2-dehydro-3-deoxygluconokinase
MNKRIAVIGECMLELTRDVSTRESSGMPMNLSYGGDTLNTAVYMARLGVDVSYFTALGDDPYSDWMIQQWKTEKVGCDSVVRVSGRLPGIYSIETDGSGERRFYYWRDQAPARELFDEPEHRSKLFEQLMAYDLIYLSGITLSLYKPTCLEALFAFLKDYPGTFTRKCIVLQILVYQRLRMSSCCTRVMKNSMLLHGCGS